MGVKAAGPRSDEIDDEVRFDAPAWFGRTENAGDTSLI